MVFDRKPKGFSMENVVGSNSKISASPGRPLSKRCYRFESLHFSRPCEELPQTHVTQWNKQPFELVGVRGFEPPTPSSRRKLTI